MLGIFDELSGNAVAMRQALQLLPWLREELAIAEATKDGETYADRQEPAED
jgi:hypothetical protein